MFEERIAEMNRNCASTVPASPETEKRVYTVDEIQDILGVSRTTTYRLIKSGVFHSVRVGGQHRISKRASTLGWITLQALSRIVKCAIEPIASLTVPLEIRII